VVEVDPAEQLVRPKRIARCACGVDRVPNGTR
jgi:hypothetical protein